MLFYKVCPDGNQIRKKDSVVSMEFKGPIFGKNNVADYEETLPMLPMLPIIQRL